jgi:hypothetical protein
MVFGVYRIRYEVAIITNHGFPFDCTSGVPARLDTFIEAPLYNSSAAIPRFHLVVNNFPAGSGWDVAKRGGKGR